MLAQRAYKVLRKLLSDIFVAAYGATPYGLPFSGNTYCLRLWLDVVMVVFVCHRRHIVQNLHIRYLSDKHRMRSEIFGLIDLNGNIGICTFCNIKDAVCTALTMFITVKFIHIAP